MKKHILYIIFFSLIMFSCKKKTTEDTETIERVEVTEGFTGIEFQELNFEELLEKASKEDKLIFIDCYTSWCAPCKWMDKNVFVKEEVYEFYNKTFINAKIDMEKGEGPELAKKYGVQSYPTYLFINAKGEVVHKATSKLSVKNFIAEGKNAINPEKALGSLSEKYQNGVISNEEIVNYLFALNKIRDPKSKEVYEKLLSNVDADWLKSPSGWTLIQTFVFDEKHELFDILDTNRDYFNEIAGSEAVNEIYKRSLMRNMNLSSKAGDEELFFTQLDSLKKLTNSPRDIAIIHSNYFVNRNDAENFVKTTDYYVNNFLQEDSETIAFIARSASIRSQDNMGILKQSAAIIDKSYKMDPNNYGTVGTYAQILSAIGEREKAIELGEIAVKMADTISSKVKNRAMENLEAIKIRD